MITSIHSLHCHKQYFQWPIIEQHHEKTNVLHMRKQRHRYFNRVPTGQGKVREICFSFKVREKSGNFVKWSGKLENVKKSGKSQGILKLC